MKIKNQNLLMLQAIAHKAPDTPVGVGAKFFLDPNVTPALKQSRYAGEGSFMQALVKGSFMEAFKRASESNRRILMEALNEGNLYAAKDMKAVDRNELDAEELAEDLREVERTLMDYYRLMEDLHPEPESNHESFTKFQSVTQALRLLTLDLSSTIDQVENL